MALEAKESCGKLTEEGFVPPPGQEHVLFWRRATFCSVKERWNINVFQERGWSAEVGNSAVPFKKKSKNLIKFLEDMGKSFSNEDMYGAQRMYKGSMKESFSGIFAYGDRFNSCQVIYSQFGLAIHQNDHQARRRFVEWAQNEIAVVPDFHKRILFSDEAHFWLNGYVNKQNCRIWSEANPQVYVETPLHPEKLTVWCALWAGGILLQKR
ncbi:hypothetical protein TNCV_3975111 [Trichonephila clavipes]|nr:hypothetical protein TNCV_3975111 [Trichonephila clavipes]